MERRKESELHQVHHPLASSSSFLIDLLSRHALRECDILKTLDHPRIVRLYDVFEIDTDSCVTPRVFIERHSFLLA